MNLRSIILLVAGLTFAACTQTDRGVGRSSPTTTPSASPTAAVGTPAPESPHPVSLPALMQKEFDGRDLSIGRVLEQSDAYTRHAITYKSGSLTISGIMNIPRGDGPFPVLILNHGYIDPDIYTTGRGLRREQDYLARRGFVVFHVDYRNHADSDDDPETELRLRLGYVEDVINAVMAVQKSSIPQLDAGRVGMLGRSMGGGVSLSAVVVKPDLVDAVVLFAPVSSDYVDNFNKWIRGGVERREIAERVMAAYGAPEQNPAFWRNVSAVTFFERISVPILVHHGTSDESVPLEWSQKTLTALQSHKKDAQLHIYPGEHHAFSFDWVKSMERTVAFFNARLSS